MSIDELTVILTKIEKETHNFHFLRYYTRIKLIILVFIIFLSLTGILLFSIARDFNTRLIMASKVCFLAMLLVYLSHSFYKKFIKSVSVVENMKNNKKNQESAENTENNEESMENQENSSSPKSLYNYA